MGKQKRSWSAEQKLTIVLTVLKEQASVGEVSRQHGAAESLIHKWNAQSLKHGNAKTPDKALQAENEQLEKLLGAKTLEVDILKSFPASSRWVIKLIQRDLDFVWVVGLTPLHQASMSFARVGP